MWCLKRSRSNLERMSGQHSVYVHSNFLGGGLRLLHFLMHLFRAIKEVISFSQQQLDGMLQLTSYNSTRDFSEMLNIYQLLWKPVGMRRHFWKKETICWDDYVRTLCCLLCQLLGSLGDDGVSIGLHLTEMPSASNTCQSLKAATGSILTSFSSAIGFRHTFLGKLGIAEATAKCVKDTSNKNKKTVWLS